MSIFKKEVIGENYMTRWTLLSLFGFRLYLHRFVGSDSGRHMHDHPCSYVTLPIKGGGYTEAYYPDPARALRDAGIATALSEWDPPSLQTLRQKAMLAMTRHVLFQEVPSWTLTFRPAEHTHRVIVWPDRKPVWTLVLMLRNRRRWGFYTEQGWIDAQEYKNA